MPEIDLKWNDWFDKLAKAYCKNQAKAVGYKDIIQDAVERANEKGINLDWGEIADNVAKKEGNAMPIVEEDWVKKIREIWRDGVEVDREYNKARNYFGYDVLDEKAGERELKRLTDLVIDGWVTDEEFGKGIRVPVNDIPVRRFTEATVFPQTEGFAVNPPRQIFIANVNNTIAKPGLYQFYGHTYRYSGEHNPSWYRYELVDLTPDTISKKLSESQEPVVVINRQTNEENHVWELDGDFYVLDGGEKITFESAKVLYRLT